MTFKKLFLIFPLLATMQIALSSQVKQSEQKHKEEKGSAEKRYNEKASLELWLALEKNDLAKVNAAIDRGADVNGKLYAPGMSRHNETPLIAAARNNRFNIVQRLLQEPMIRVNECNAQGNTALFYAIQYCLSDIVDLLLSIPSINVNIIGQKSGDSVLAFAINAVCQNKEYEPMVHKLIFANARYITTYGRTELTLNQIKKNASTYVNGDRMVAAINEGLRLKQEWSKELIKTLHDKTQLPKEIIVLIDETLNKPHPEQDSTDYWSKDIRRHIEENKCYLLYPPKEKTYAYAALYKSDEVGYTPLAVAIHRKCNDYLIKRLEKLMKLAEATNQAEKAADKTEEDDQQDAFDEMAKKFSFKESVEGFALLLKENKPNHILIRYLNDHPWVEVDNKVVPIHKAENDEYPSLLRLAISYGNRDIAVVLIKGGATLTSRGLGDGEYPQYRELFHLAQGDEERKENK